MIVDEIEVIRIPVFEAENNPPITGDSQTIKAVILTFERV